MVDTHCHLNFHSFKKNYNEVAGVAFDAGVTKIINVGAKLDSSRRAVKISSEIPFCFAAVGVHPHHAAEMEDSSPQWNSGKVNQNDNEISFSKVEKELEQIIEEDLKTTKKIVAIGECGLDYHEYQKNPPDVETRNCASLQVNTVVQKNLLDLHFRLAKKYNLPLIIHCREAYSDLLELLRTTYYLPRGKAGVLRTSGVIHCFQGSLSDLKQFLELGFYIGYDGYITYAKNYEELVAATPLNRILTETDSPWLTPEPLRGKLNSPANIKIITEKIAEIKKMPFEEVDKITTENAEKLFF